jgi:capsular exopolysaccharide synthesis family protein
MRRLEQPFSGTIDSHVVSLTATESYDAEQYRKLRYILEERYCPGTGLVVGICSPASGDGKSLTAVNLAAALAESPAVRVLLVDADLRRGSASLKSLLGLRGTGRPGLADAVLLPGITLQSVVTQAVSPNLSVVLAGVNTAKPYETLRSVRFGQFMNEARAKYDYIIVDTPPVVPVPDCQVMARKIDLFLMVVAAHRTPRPMLEEALNVMEPGKLLGLVFNNSDLMPARYYGYYRYGKSVGASSTAAAMPVREITGEKTRSRVTASVEPRR